MKRLKYLLIAGVSLLLTSCENFLDRQPESSLSGETFWTSEQDLKTWNAGMYDGLQSTLRTNWFYWGELRSGVYAERGTAYDRNLLYNGLNSQSGSSSWSDLYKTIYRANAAIKHIPTSPIGSSVSAPYLGQAYAMRALMYFYAIRVWGGVPKITHGRCLFAGTILWKNFCRRIESFYSGRYRESIRTYWCFYRYVQCQ